MMDKRGSSAVFLCVIMGALMTIALVLIHAVKEHTASSMADGLADLASISLLSEFDINVMEGYGLFMMDGSDDDLSKKAHRYISYTADDIGLGIRDIRVSGSRYSLSDVSLAEDQILKHAKALMTAGIFDDDAQQTRRPDEDDRGRTLRNRSTMISLPSRGMPGSSLTGRATALAENITGVNDVFRTGTEEWLFDSYILSLFNDAGNVRAEDHFFRSEVEYILAGKMSDAENERAVEAAITAMRFPLNLIHIYTDAEKRSAVLAASQAAGPGSAAVQALISAAWAYAESDNDVELLRQGRKVPVLKDDRTWAIGLEDVIEGITGGTVIPEDDRGCDYGDYLRIMLFFEERGVKTARILDLVQINMRASYDGDFLIHEHFTGIEISLVVNGRERTYEKEY